MSTHIPVWSTYLLDKFIVLAEANNIEPIICVTKLDLLSLKEKTSILKELKYYKKLGYKVIKNTEVNKIKKEIKNKTVCLTGQTGAGKSTLLNKIDKTLNLKVDEVSKSLKRGKHTTRLVELMEINNGLIADTPGFSSLELNMDKNDIKNHFKEFNIACKYKTCNHIKEEGCKVIELVNKNKILKSRYENYLKLLESVK